jgi:hypothetical protein
VDKTLDPNTVRRYIRALRPLRGKDDCVNVTSFDDIAEEFDRRIRRVVWCSVSTIDRHDRTRVRILHPIWTGSIGWIATNRDSLKAKHLAHNPHVSLAYLEQLNPWGTEQVYADCVARWEDAPTSASASGSSSSRLRLHSATIRD